MQGYPHLKVRPIENIFEMCGLAVASEKVLTMSKYLHVKNALATHWTRITFESGLYASAYRVSHMQLVQATISHKVVS